MGISQRNERQAGVYNCRQTRPKRAHGHRVVKGIGSRGGGDYGFNERVQSISCYHLPMNDIELKQLLMAIIKKIRFLRRGLTENEIIEIILERPNIVNDEGFPYFQPILVHKLHRQFS